MRGQKLRAGTCRGKQVPKELREVHGAGRDVAHSPAIEAAFVRDIVEVEVDLCKISGILEPVDGVLV